MAQVRKTIIKQSSHFDSIKEEFDKMIGLRDPDAVVVVELYESIMSNTADFMWAINKLYDVLMRVSSSIVTEVVRSRTKFTELSSKFKENGEYRKIRLNTGLISKSDIKALNKDKEFAERLEKLVKIDYEPTLLVEVWKKIKVDEFISLIKVTASNIKTLLDAEKSRSRTPEKGPNCFDTDPIKPDFLENAMNDTAIVLGWTDLNFKNIYDACRDADTQSGSQLVEIMLALLRIIYQLAIKIHKTHTSPDINVKDFSAKFVKALTSAKKDFPGHERAFDELRKSGRILEERFNDYYYDVITTGNPYIIVDRFISDIMETTTDTIAKSQLIKLTHSLKSKLDSKGDKRMSNVLKEYTKLTELKDKE